MVSPEKQELLLPCLWSFHFLGNECGMELVLGLAGLDVQACSTFLSYFLLEQQSSNSVSRPL